MIDFVNPGILGNLVTFNNIFAKTIDASRDKNANSEAKRMGESRSAEVSVSLLLLCIRSVHVNRQFVVCA